MATKEETSSSVDERLKALVPTVIGCVTEGGHVGIHSAFLNKARGVEEQGDQPLVVDLKLLADAFSMYLLYCSPLRHEPR